MALHDLGRRMEQDPEEEVTELAQSSTNTFNNCPIGEQHAGQVALGSFGFADDRPEGECLSRRDDKAIQVLDRQPEILNLIALEPHIRRAQCAHQERLVPRDDARQKCR